MDSNTPATNMKIKKEEKAFCTLSNSFAPKNCEITTDAPDTDHQRDNKVIDEEGSRYRRQRLFPQKLPDDDAVGHVIELLQQIADQQRESETQDHLPYRPTRQIPISCINSQFSILNFQFPIGLSAGYCRLPLSYPHVSSAGLSIPC